MHTTPRPCGAASLTFRNFYLCIAACLMVGAAAQGATEGYWRFENGAFLNDSSGNARALSNTDTEGDDQYTLPATGPGASFPDPIPQTLAANIQGALFTSSQFDSMSAADSNLSALIYEKPAFTIEAFVNLTDASIRRTIASKWTSGGSEIYRFDVLSSTDTNARSLDFEFFGLRGSGGTIDIQIPAFIPLTLGVDYYVSVSLDFVNDSLDFYVQDLTNNGALQHDHVNIPDSTAVYFSTASTTSFRVGSIFGGSNWNGVIDEVRFSSSALSTSQLLVVPEPSSTVLALLGLLGACALPRLRVRQPA